MVRRSFAALALIVVSLGCGGSSDNGDASTSTSLVPPNYQATFVQVRDCRTTVAHASADPVVTNIRVLINPSSAAAYLANAPTLPVGTVVIKEESSADDCSSITAWSVNVKEAPGTDPSSGDWRWQRVSASNNAVLTTPTVPACISCHQTCDGAGAMNRDLMCTTP